MRRHDRLTNLLDELARNGTIEIDEAAARLAVSPATIRRDLDALDEEGLLVRTRGGALPTSVAYDLPLRYKIDRNAAAKQAIARVAAELVPPGAAVALNGGTTTTEVARVLGSRTAGAAGSANSGNSGSHGGNHDSRPRMTVVTNALNIASELALRPEITVVVTGGVVRMQSYELVGHYADLVVDQLSFDVAVLGVGGISVAAGACTPHEGEAAVNGAMARRAREVIVVADASKLGMPAFARICTVDEVDVLVTDASAAPAAVDDLTAAGVKVVVAD